MDSNNSRLLELAKLASEGHQQTQNCFREGVKHAEQAGKALIKAKSRIASGQWGSWLAENFGGSERTAQLYMRLAKNARCVDDETRTAVADLALREAAEHFSAPRTKTVQVKVVTEALIPPRPAPRAIHIVAQTVAAQPAQAPVVEPPAAPKTSVLSTPDRAPAAQTDAPAPAVGDPAIVDPSKRR